MIEINPLIPAQQVRSANRSSPHRTDQTHLYARKQWVTAAFTEREIARDPELTVRRLR